MEFLPETVLELILSKVSDEDILKCNLVCRTWNALISRKSLWKKRFENKQVNWEEVPSHIRDKPNSWMILRAHLHHRILFKNFIDNPSGHSGFDGWTIFDNNGDLWRVEEEPIGCDPLPKTELIGRNDESCFVTSYGWCSKYFMVDLWSQGLTPELLKIILPFQINCSQMYTARFDCGGKFDWELRLLDSQQKIICMYKPTCIQLPATMDWKKTEFAFQFGSGDVELLQDLRYIMFIHEGKDTQVWAGHYGMKFARSCVTIECLRTEPEENALEGLTDQFGEEGGRNTFVGRHRGW
ncbi:F-box only protein 44 [Orchesella cincta]|uniref:F-box only protein 44 n=1 Tax=Orchesella cincta TaxID=48709 RepID=A0A1D2MAA4_ORCCI|nr:F-box only protein 44 [Orchesella cincta]